MKHLFETAVFLGIIIAAGYAISGDYFSKTFGDMDLDRDDCIAYDEYEVYVTHPSKEEFKKIDLNGDRKVQLFEWVTFQQKLDPKIHRFDYRYEDRAGSLFYHQDNSWYRLSEGIVFKFGDNEWEKLGRAEIFHPYPRYRYYDPFRAPCYYHDHDHFGLGYRHGFGYNHRYRVWD